MSDWLSRGEPAAAVLLLTDDASQRGVAHASLEREGFTVESRLVGPASPPEANSPADIFGLAAMPEPESGRGGKLAALDAVVLISTRDDWDFLGFCRGLREYGQIGLPIVLVASQGTEVDRVLAIELGADDFLVLPFGQRELGARVRARVRRRRIELAANGRVGAALATTRLHAGDLVVDLEQRDAWILGRRLVLRRREFDLLAFLIQNRGRSATRDRLARLWDEPPEHGSRTLDMHVRRLREKIEREPSRPEFIHTVRGTGYRFNWEPLAERRLAGAPTLGPALDLRADGRETEEVRHAELRAGRESGSTAPWGGRLGHAE